MNNVLCFLIDNRFILTCQVQIGKCFYYMSKILYNLRDICILWGVAIHTPQANILYGSSTRIQQQM